MTLEHHRCRPGRDRTGFSSAVHHLLIYHKCTIAPPPSKPPLARGHHCTRAPCRQSRRAATSPALPPPVSPTAAEDLARRPSSTCLGCVSSHRGHRPRRLASHSYRPCLLRLVGCRPSLLRRADHPPRWPGATPSCAAVAPATAVAAFCSSTPAAAYRSLPRLRCRYLRPELTAAAATAAQIRRRRRRI